GEKEGTGKERADAGFTGWEQKEREFPSDAFVQNRRKGHLMCKRETVRYKRFENKKLFFFRFERILRGSQEVEWSHSVG
ncbi:hypothetical protein LLE87_38780, partial [Paenibacillus polymyxa]|nr:hypothetical protein [Paenibacillus polymyxa]